MFHKREQKKLQESVEFAVEEDTVSGLLLVSFFLYDQQIFQDLDSRETVFYEGMKKISLI